VKTTNAATLIYGDTGTGKTTLLATYFEWVWQKFKKKSRYYAGDLGGFGDKMQGLADAGIVEVCRFQSIDPDATRGLPIGVCAKITQGYWPVEDSWDAESGLCSPGAELIAPATVWFTMKCKQGHVVKKVNAQSLLTATACPVCKVMTTKETCLSIDKEILPNPGFEDIGCVGYDSLTSMGEWMMADLNFRAGNGTLGGMKGNINTVLSAGLTFGTGGMAAVGFAQNRIPDCPRNAVNIPGLVVPPIFTALEKKAADSDSKLPVYGPQVPGSAKTSDVPSYFGNCWIATKVQEEGREIHRLYLQGYRSANDQIPHLGKSRVSPGAIPEYVEDPVDANTENGKSFTTFNLGYVFTLLEKAAKEEHERIISKYPDAPGRKKGIELGKHVEVEKVEIVTKVEAGESNTSTPDVVANPVVVLHATPSTVVELVNVVGKPRIVKPPIIVRPRGVVPGPKVNVVVETK
jgi:hypothetical protein